jgi:hypothetical protein
MGQLNTKRKHFCFDYIYYIKPLALKYGSNEEKKNPYVTNLFILNINGLKYMHENVSDQKENI